MSLLTTSPPRRALRPDLAPAPRPQERPPLRLVPPPAPSRRRRVGLLGTLAVVALLVGVFALVAMHALVVQAQFELDRVEERVAEAEGRLHSLRLEVARLESPESIADAAAEIGMVHPADRVWLEPVAP